MVGTGLSSGRLPLGCNIHTAQARARVPSGHRSIAMDGGLVAHFSTHRRDFHLTLDLDTPSHAGTPHLTLPGDFPMSRYIHMMMLKLCLCPVFVIFHPNCRAELVIHIIYVCNSPCDYVRTNSGESKGVIASLLLSCVPADREARSRQWYAFNDSSVQPKTFIKQAEGNQFFEIFLMRPPVSTQQSLILDAFYTLMINNLVIIWANWKVKLLLI